MHRPDHLSRARLVARSKNWLARHSNPRLELLVIVALSGAVAFLSSVAGLKAGIQSMSVRYPAAVLVGYLTFVLLIRLWIAWQRRRGESDDFDIDLDPGLDPTLRDSPSTVSYQDDAFDGGRSGGAGAAESWMPGVGGSEPRTAVRGHMDADLGVDELWPVVLAVACALGGVVSIAIVVYSAPMLLAEVAVDAALVAGVYRRMRREDAAHWAVTTLRRTWFWALLTAAFAGGAGFALQTLAPEASSIGGVVSLLRS